jgi:hypothetical protein
MELISAAIAFAAFCIAQLAAVIVMTAFPDSTFFPTLSVEGTSQSLADPLDNLPRKEIGYAC